MKQLNFDFENCFGISKFKETIDFKRPESNNFSLSESSLLTLLNNTTIDNIAAIASDITVPSARPALDI